MLPDVQIPFLGTPLVPLRVHLKGGRSVFLGPGGRLRSRVVVVVRPRAWTLTISNHEIGTPDPK